MAVAAAGKRSPGVRGQAQRDTAFPQGDKRQRGPAIHRSLGDVDRVFSGSTGGRNVTTRSDDRAAAPKAAGGLATQGGGRRSAPLPWAIMFRPFRPVVRCGQTWGARPWSVPTRSDDRAGASEARHRFVCGGQGAQM